MTHENLSETKIKWLTYLVYFLLAMLTFATGWQQVIVGRIEAEIRHMPDKYVRAPRYETDIERLDAYFCRIDAKIDRLMERAP